MPIDRDTTAFTGNGNSTPIRIDEKQEVGNKATVAFSIAGTWSGVTAKLQMCADPTASPQTWVDVTSASYTANVADTWELALGCHFRVNISGSGSPLPALTLVTVREVTHGGSTDY